MSYNSYIEPYRWILSVKILYTSRMLIDVELNAKHVTEEVNNVYDPEAAGTVLLDKN